MEKKYQEKLNREYMNLSGLFMNIEQKMNFKNQHY